jgi:sec-independent protein translocase protein TatB
MFDIGWTELLLIGIVALIVVGPKDLPGMFRTVGNFVGKARRMAKEFQRSMEDAANEAGLSEATKGFSDLKKGDPLGLNSIKDSNKKYTESIMATRDAKIAERAAKAESAADAAKVDAPAKPAAVASPASEPKAEPAAVSKPKAAAKPKATVKPTAEATPKVAAKPKAAAKPKPKPADPAIEES